MYVRVYAYMYISSISLLPAAFIQVWSFDFNKCLTRIYYRQIWTQFVLFLEIWSDLCESCCLSWVLWCFMRALQFVSIYWEKKTGGLFTYWIGRAYLLVDWVSVVSKVCAVIWVWYCLWVLTIPDLWWNLDGVLFGVCKLLLLSSGIINWDYCFSSNSFSFLNSWGFEGYLSYSSCLGLMSIWWNIILVGKMF